MFRSKLCVVEFDQEDKGGNPLLSVSLRQGELCRLARPQWGGDIWQKGVSSKLAIPVGISEYE